MKALGLMSGTSLDGIDAAILDTDGEHINAFGPALCMPYPADFRDKLRAGKAEYELTLLHVEAVKKLLEKYGHSVDVIGFHGHTVEHRPIDGITKQIGDGALLAKETQISVVNDFRTKDVAAGGQGAPLVPVFHAALAEKLEKPLCILNIGGVANVTYLGSNGEIIAFDTGPGNAPLNDWMEKNTGALLDKDGQFALSGTSDNVALKNLLDHPYFETSPPKSLDRDDFNMQMISGLSAADGAATLTDFSAHAVAKSLKFLPENPERWLVCGGGRHNPTLMAALENSLNTNVEPVETVGWDGDYLEAQAFAFLAVRSLKGLPLTFPTTTGVTLPTTGGVLYKV